MSEDAYVARWSGLLYIFVALAALFTVVSPLYALTHECQLELTKGQEIWKTSLHDLRTPDFAAFLGAAMLPRGIWLAVLWEVLKLAQHYRLGRIFEESNARRLARIGSLLVAMGVIQCVMEPIVTYFLYWRGISPWLGDMTLIDVIQPDYVMAGLFFLIFGNVMRRAVELEETRRLIV